MKNTFRALTFSTLFLSLAANAAVTGGYVGGGLGYSVLHTQSSAMGNILGASSTSLSSSTGGLGGRLFLGYNFTRFFGLELGWSDFNKSAYSGNATLAGVTANSYLNYSMWEVDLVGKAYAPIKCSGFNGYLLGGFANVNENNRLNTTLPTALAGSTTAHKFRPRYGLGLTYEATKMLTTGLEWSRVQGTNSTSGNIKAIPTADMVLFTFAFHADQTPPPQPAQAAPAKDQVKDKASDKA